MARHLPRMKLRGHLRHRIDKDLQRYVIRDEIVVVAVRQHWMGHLKPFLACFAVLMLAVWVDINGSYSALVARLSQILWLIWLISLAWVGWVVLNWRRDWFVATNKRFLMFYGFIHRRVDMMPLAKVTDLSFNRSILGRLLGYGDFTLESAGQHQALSHIGFIPKADEHYREICEVLFGGGESSGDDAEREDDPVDDGPDGDGYGDSYRDDRGGDGGPAGSNGGGSGYAVGPGQVGYARQAGYAVGPGPSVGSPTRDERPRDAWAFGLPVPEHLLRPTGGAAHDDVLYRTDGTTPRGSEVVYSSVDADRAFRRADTAEIPVVPALPLPRRTPPLPPRLPKRGQ